MARGVLTPTWPSVWRHRVRGFTVPFLLVLQHHIVDSRTRIAAPLVTAPAGHPGSILTPSVTIDAVAHRVMLLDMAAVPLPLFVAVVGEVSMAEDDISAGLDAIFRGYPVGLAP